MPQHSIVTLRPRFNPVVKLTSPPRHLDEEEQALFRAVVAEFEVNDSASISLLTTAMEAHMRMREAGITLAKEGTVIKNRFGARTAHPAVAIERDARNDFLRAMKTLNLSRPDAVVR
jgi:P27 family predicted phage terminase small subunit